MKSRQLQLVREERPDAPLGLEALVEQMLAKEAAERPNAREVLRACTDLLAAVPPGSEADRSELAPGLVEGDVIGGKYRVERKLGEGGMGVVIAARHLELGTRVAIKLLRPGDAEEGRFLREAQATSRIESDHVARVLDVGRTTSAQGGRPFIVMEHLRGVDLARRLVERGPLPIHVAVGHVLEACEALAEAHALGIVHRDLKPSNLFIVQRRDGSEFMKVLDFGISKLTRSLEGSGPSVALTATADTAVMGSIAYMSPEQVESSACVDARSDIWSLGVVLFEVLSGSRPFEGESAVAVAARIAGSAPRSLRGLRADLPAKLEAVLVTCLAKDPAARYEDVAELARALRPFGAAAQPPQRTPQPPAEDPPTTVGAAPQPPSEEPSALGIFAAGHDREPAEAGGRVRDNARRSPKRALFALAGATALAGIFITLAGSRPAKPSAATTSFPPSLSSGSSVATERAAAAPMTAEAQPAPVPSIRSAPSQAPAPLGKPTVSSRHGSDPTMGSAPRSSSAGAASSRAASPPSGSAPKRDVDLRDPLLDGR